MGNKSYFDEAIVKTLQRDCPTTRKSIEWITKGILTPDFTDGLKVGPRRPNTIDGTKKEVDLNLEQVVFTLTCTPDESYIAGLHVEVEASGELSPIRMFNYDYALAKHYSNGAEVLQFPLSFVVLLDKSKTVKDNTVYSDGITALDAIRVLMCNYRYYVRVLSGDCENTVFHPIAFANSNLSVSGENSFTDMIRIIQGVTDGLPEDLREHYSENIYTVDCNSGLRISSACSGVR